MDSEKRLNTMNGGRMAEIAFAHFGQLLEDESKKIVESLKSDHRNGNHDHVKMASGIAAICALDDIKTKLEKQISRGRREEKEILNAPGNHP